MTVAVKRQVVDVAGREVCFRYAGSGPPFLLLHESPRSSVALLPLMERLAGEYTVFGLDNPGFGGSDPLPLERPASSDYAAAVADVMTVLGLRKVPVYGTHTGACIAAAMASRHPDRVAVAILDGYPIFTRSEREELLRDYLPPFVPAWDGTHVAWLWARVRDQFTFFPWYAAGQEGRLPRDPPPLAFHQLVVEDFLRAGDDYCPAYASAFRFDGIETLQSCRSPVAVTARSDDLLFPHLDRLPEALPERAEVHRLGPDRDKWAACIGDIARRHVVQTDVSEPALEWPEDRPIARRIVQVGGVSSHVRRGGAGSGQPLLLLHRLPGSAGEFDDQVRRLARHRPVIAPDLPGCGDTDAPDEVTLDFVIDWLEQLMAVLGFDRYDIAGEDTGGALAAALAARGGTGAKVVTLSQMSMPLDDATSESPALPDLTPRWDGGHLMAAWYWARDSLLYRNWWDRRADAVWPIVDDPDLGRLHARFVGAVLGADSHSQIHEAAQGVALVDAIDAAERSGVRVDRTNCPLAAYPWEAGT